MMISDPLGLVGRNRRVTKSGLHSTSLLDCYLGTWYLTRLGTICSVQCAPGSTLGLFMGTNTEDLLLLDGGTH